MPRKASQAAKKEASAETKNEGASSRRSGRATTKQEPSKESGKEATRSRRSSTAAQTAASVADSKTPKRSAGSRGEDTSPSEGRQKSRRESVETSSTRVRTARRASSRVNYKESDGEEENAAPKYDENFDSNEEFGDSDSDEKNKSKGKTRGAKSPAKSRGAKDKAKSGRGRRGRPKKQSSDEEDMEPIELSEESIEVEEEIIKKPETPTRGGRSRRGKAESEAKSEEKSTSRRSARASSVKEPPKKRPSRSLQAKRYTEDDDDDDIEEIDSKDEEDAKPQTESGRKRKRGSAAESNKRPKEEEIEDLTKDDDDDKEKADEKEKLESVSETEKEKEVEKKEIEEKMDVDEDDAKDGTEETKPTQKDDKSGETPEPAKEEIKDKDKEETDKIESKSSKEKLSLSNKQGSVDSSENLDESMHSFDSDQGSRAEQQSISSSLEDSQDTKETKTTENKVSVQEASASENTKSKVDNQGENSDSFQGDESSESKSLKETVINNDQKPEPSADKKETNLDSKIDNHEESLSEGSNSVQENKIEELDSKTPVTPTPISVSHSKEPTNDTSFNGSENIPNSSPVIHSAPAVSLHPEESAPKANGAHDVHSNSVSENDQYYLLPGRKYIKNSKLGESIRQSVKDKSFGFVSYNLGIMSADSSIQKEKLLNELNKLDAHIICIQQVSNSFYCGILEPSLDALGFKGTFSQPEESEKGMATFYKSSLFRLCGQSEASLKHLIEKEIEASSLDTSDRIAVKSYVKKCGHILLTHFATVIGMHSVTVANVQVPPTDLSIHALQVSCLVKEVVRVNGGTSRPFLLGGEFNMIESEASYQLLRDGYLSNDMIEELQRRKDVSLPGKENAALVNLLWKSFQHPSSTLCSCYKSVLDHEVFIPEKKATSRDLLWYSSDSLYSVGVLDASETLSDHHFSLKADIAFSV